MEKLPSSGITSIKNEAGQKTVRLLSDLNQPRASSVKSIGATSAPLNMATQKESFTVWQLLNATVVCFTWSLHTHRGRRPCIDACSMPSGFLKELPKNWLPTICSQQSQNATGPSYDSMSPYLSSSAPLPLSHTPVMSEAHTKRAKWKRALSIISDTISFL